MICKDIFTIECGDSIHFGRKITDMLASIIAQYMFLSY